jgi:hypothetical protein
MSPAAVMGATSSALPAELAAIRAAIALAAAAVERAEDDDDGDLVEARVVLRDLIERVRKLEETVGMRVVPRLAVRS